MRPPRLLKTCSARVGESSVLRLALGAAQRHIRRAEKRLRHRVVGTAHRDGRAARRDLVRHTGMPGNDEGERAGPEAFGQPRRGRRPFGRNVCYPCGIGNVYNEGVR